jgi:hypothetical protein
MKKATRIAFCLIGFSVFVTFVGMMTAVNLVVASAIGATFGAGLYGCWLRDEARVKFFDKRVS